MRFNSGNSHLFGNSQEFRGEDAPALPRKHATVRTKAANRKRRGSVLVMYMMIMGTLVTGTVASVAVLSNSETQSGSIGFDRQQAFYAAEAGIERAVWNLNHNATNFVAGINVPTTGTVYSTGPSYTVTCTTANPNWPTTPLSFQSVGTSADGKVTSQTTITVTDTVSNSPGFSPGFAMAGSNTFSGTLNIAGSFETTSAIVSSGTVKLTNVPGQPAASLESMSTYTGAGTLTVPGNMLFNGNVVANGTVNVGGSVQSGGTITHSGTGWHVTGTTTARSSPGLAFSTPPVDTTGLIAGSYGSVQVISGGSPSSLTLDFSKNPVIAINSNLTLGASTVITIIPPASGNGTLVVNGTLGLSTSIGSSSSYAAMNIVTTGNITQSGNQYITGSLCCGGSLTCSGTYNVNGVVVVHNGITGAGTMNMGYVAPPSFVQWSSAGAGVGSTSTNIIAASKFMGPMY